MANITEEKWIEMLEKKADGTFVAKYPKVKSKSGITFDEHLADIASKTEFGHVKLSSAVDSTSEDLAATPKAVKTAYDKAKEKPFVVGTYTGNNSYSRKISLGFRPSAVYVIAKNGDTFNSYSSYYVGGLALDGYPVMSYAHDEEVVSITSSGFTVYYDSDEKIYANSDSSKYNPFRYIAFK